MQAGAIGQGGEIFVLDMGSADQNPRPRPRNDPPQRTEARRGHPDPDHRHPARAKSCTKSSPATTNRPGQPRTGKSASGNFPSPAHNRSAMMDRLKRVIDATRDEVVLELTKCVPEYQPNDGSEPIIAKNTPAIPASVAA